MKKLSAALSKVSGTVGEMSGALGEVSGALGEVSRYIGKMYIRGNFCLLTAEEIERFDELNEGN